MNLAFIRPLCTLVILFEFVKDENTKLSPCDEMHTFKLNLPLQALNSREGLAELLVPQTIVSGKPRTVGSAAPKPAPAPIFPHARPSASARPSAPSGPPSPLPIHKVGLPSPRRSVPGVLDPPSVQHGPTRAHASPCLSTPPRSTVGLQALQIHGGARRTSFTDSWPAGSARQCYAASNSRFK